MTYDNLTEKRLQKYADDKLIESREVVTLDVLDDLVTKILRINMADSNAQSRIENLFVSYYMFFRRKGLFWLLKSNKKWLYNTSRRRPDLELYGLVSNPTRIFLIIIFVRTSRSS